MKGLEDSVEVVVLLKKHLRLFKHDLKSLLYKKHL